YVNFKRVVWHKAFAKLLESISLLSKTGYAHKCYDKVLRYLFPLILILSADYEEQCVMALIRGFGGKCPCPVCLVPEDELFDHSKTHPLRTIDGVQELLALYDQDRAAGEELLKKQGLRPIANVFFTIAHSDPFRALSFDILHAFHLGLFGRHLFSILKQLLKDLGREAEQKFDDAFAAFPRWRNLNHFSSATNKNFTDGNKFQDISKQVIYAAQHIFDRKKQPVGYHLLRCIASYLQLDMYLSMDVHTETTIRSGELELLVFQRRLEEYIEVSGDEYAKNWKFPKNHAGKHSFRDVLAKGAARNFTTRVNEKHHDPIKKTYKLQTNGKEIAGQVLRIDHETFTGQAIRARIDALDEDHRRRILSESEPEDDESDDRPFDLEQHHHLGAAQKPISLQDLEAAHHHDRAFKDFRKKLVPFINNHFQVYGIPLANWLILRVHDEIEEHRYLKLHYESLMDWRLATDHLRCSPSFHGHPRNDCVLARVLDRDVEKLIFARILSMFVFKHDGRSHHFALILAFDKVAGPQRQSDLELGLTRIRARLSAMSEFVPIASFVRGALIVPDFDRPGDHFVVDTIDADMFLRVPKLNQ
ncbi:hypothetical protein BJ138DRAFT_1020830, partial [Hygrophoropsis aurantiaca]